jgi:hypothetical protein
MLDAHAAGEREGGADALPQVGREDFGGARASENFADELRVWMIGRPKPRYEYAMSPTMPPRSFVGMEADAESEWRPMTSLPLVIAPRRVPLSRPGSTVGSQ